MAKVCSSGFSLVEVLIVLLVASILLSIGVPPYLEFTANNRIIANTHGFVGALAFARTEAVRRGRVIRVSAIDSAGAGNEWGPGLGIWFDANGDDNYNAGEEIRQTDSLTSGQTIDSLGNIVDFSFGADGLVTPLTGDTFYVCDDRIGESGQAINLLGGGGVSVSSFTCS
jgi:type IV fimbrial biogenesis protein FimT